MFHILFTFLMFLPIAATFRPNQKAKSASFARRTPTIVYWSTQTGLEGFDCATHTSPRAWLESLPNGAYTVLRCDLESASANKWRVWGKDFHLQRLQDSYVTHCALEAAAVDAEDVVVAREQTKVIMNQLQIQAADSFFKEPPQSGTCVTFMLTLLWYCDNSETKVCGHFCSTGEPVSSNQALSSPKPIEVVIGMGDSLPSRKPHPEAKLSSWCTTRRPLENRFLEHNEFNDIILTDRDVLLESLTANLFVVYPGPTIRTAGNNTVLEGYGRFLVLECAKTHLSINVDTVNPIRMDEAHLWQDVFLTSSVKLMVPVENVWILSNDQYKILWTRDRTNPSIWNEILAAVMTKTE